MKKIHADLDQKDRVVCETARDSHAFYYQPARSNSRTLLFTTPYFSGSVFAYFRDKGTQQNERGFSLTVGQLYSYRQYSNIRLAHTIDHIAIMLDYVLREGLVRA